MHILSWLRNQKDHFDLSEDRACKEKKEREVCKQKLCQGSKEGPGMQQGGVERVWTICQQQCEAVAVLFWKLFLN